MTDTPNGQPPPSPTEGKKYWLEQRPNVEKIFWGLVLVCAALGLADFFYDKHPQFAMEEIPAIYGLFGFVCFFGIVLAGKKFAKLVRRDEDYYD